MENRKSLILLLKQITSLSVRCGLLVMTAMIGIVLSLLLLAMTITPRHVFAYELSTHAALTQEIAHFYNQYFPNASVDQPTIQLLMEGSVREDDGVRWMNHYYDPINHTGLTFPGGWLSSKAWAHDSRMQTAALYNPLKSTTLAFYHDMLDPAPLEATDFTWERAISDYLQGDTARAFTGLGHILHLLEDAAVPDHTRDDPHPAMLVDGNDIGHAGSPYELWAAQFNPENIHAQQYLYLKQPIAFNTLDEYFDAIANYSNKNFFSKDTIDDQKYTEPKVDYILNIDGNFYGFKKDLYNGDYRLIVFPHYTDPVVGTKIGRITELENDSILSDYWERLAPKAVQYGAGVIDLFFREVAKAKANNIGIKPQPQSLLSQLMNAAANLIGGIVPAFKEQLDPWKEVAVIPWQRETQNVNRKTNKANEISSVGNNVNEQSRVVKRKEEVSRVDDTPGVVIARLPDLPQPSIASSSSIVAVVEIPPPLTVTPVIVSSAASVGIQASGELKSCAFQTTQLPSFQSVLISEVAWMGTEQSASNEWIELHNISGRDFDISNWQLVDRDVKIHVTFPPQTILQSDAYVLLERTDDTSVPEIIADMIYVGALNNTNEGLRLFDGQCTLIDEVLANPDWPSGDGSTPSTSSGQAGSPQVLKRSMERQMDRSWKTYYGTSGGTPKRSNSIQEATPTIASNVAPAVATFIIASTTPRVLISEISAGTSANADDEFVELYNAGDIAVDLKNWSLKKKSNSGSTSTFVSASAFTGTIAPKSFFLVAHNSYGSTGSPQVTGSVSPDLRYSANSVTLAYTNNSVVLYDPADAIIDEAHWSEIPKGQSIERKALQNNVCTPAIADAVFLGNGCDTNVDTDFDVRATRDPQNRTSFPEPRMGPTFGPLHLEYDAMTQKLKLNWSAGLDARGTTTGIFYTVRDASDPVSPLDFATTTNLFFDQSITAVGRAYHFLVQAFDQTGVPGATSEVATTVPGFLPRTDFYRENRKNKLDLHFDTYPFLHGLYSGQNRWKALAFYLNTLPPVPNRGYSFDAWSYWSPPDHPSLLTLRYVAPSGNRDRTALLLPDMRGIADQNLPWNSLDYDQIEDNQIHIEVHDREESFSAGDYFTTALYDFVGGLGSGFLFTTSDETKHFFNDVPPENLLPTSLTGLAVERYDTGNNILFLTHPVSTDPDGRDFALRYQINYAESPEYDRSIVASTTPAVFDETRWRPIRFFGYDDSPYYSRRMRVGVGDLVASTTYVFGARVIDERGGTSTVAVSAPHTMQ